jgi:hypothetical protein
LFDEYAPVFVPTQRVVLRVSFMIITGALGVQLGIYVQTRLLRDRLQLAMFGFDQGTRGGLGRIYRK